MTDLEECDAIVADVLMAWRFFSDEGRELTGAALLRWRQLPERERVYFRALVAPYEDKHYGTRTQTPVHQEDGSVLFLYDPPLPAPCSCKRPVFIDIMHNSVRCVRCLHAWSLRRQEAAECAGDLMPAVLWKLGDVDRLDMGYALEQVLT